MSQVEYRCSICQSRLFAEPGMNDVYKCRNHPEEGMKQTEEFIGPNFQWRDEGDNDPRKTGVLTHGTENIFTVKVKPKPVTLTPDQERVMLRAQYERVTGKPVDRRWGIKRLKDAIEQFDRDAYLATLEDVQENESLLSSGKSGANFAISN